MEIRFKEVVVDCMNLRRATGKLAAGGCCRNASTLLSISGANGEGHPPKMANKSLALKFDRGGATSSDVCKILNFARAIRDGDKVIIHSNKGLHRAPAATIAFLTSLGMHWKVAVEVVFEHFPNVTPDNQILRCMDKLLDTKAARYSARLAEKRDARVARKKRIDARNAKRAARRG